MKRTVRALSICLSLSFAAAAGAAREGLRPQTGARPGGRDGAGATRPSAPAVDTFRRIRRRMSMRDVVRLCGEPARDVGSGIHVYVYDLADGSEVRVGTPDDRRIMYVTHVLADGRQRPLLKGK